MFTKTRTFAAVAAGAGALMLVGAAPATAAPAGPSSQGATPYKYEFCNDFGDWTYCYVGHGESNLVTTPSGNTIYQNNGTFEYTVTDPNGQVASGKQFTNHRTVWKEGEPQVDHWSSHGSYEEGGQTCDYSYITHYANGEVRISDYRNSCFA